MIGGTGAWCEFTDEPLKGSVLGSPGQSPPTHIDDSLASLLSIFDCEQLTTSPPADAINLSTITGFDDLAPFDEFSSYSGYSPASQVDTIMVMSPASSQDFESARESTCPSSPECDPFEDLLREFEAADQALSDGRRSYEVSGEELSFEEIYESYEAPQKERTSKKCQGQRTRPYKVTKKVFRLEDLEPEERQLRKKEQNKTAASRYRQKKKAEKSTIEEEAEELQERNRELKGQVNGITKEIRYLKGLMKEVLQAKKMKNPKGNL